MDKSTKVAETARQSRQYHANQTPEISVYSNSSTFDKDDTTIHGFYHQLLQLFSRELRSGLCDQCRAEPVKTRAEDCLSLLYMWAQGLDLAYLENKVEKESQLQATVATLLAGVARITTSKVFSASDGNQYESWIASFTSHHRGGTDFTETDSEASSSSDDGDEVPAPFSDTKLDHGAHLRLLRRLENDVHGLMNLLPTLQHRCNAERLPLTRESQPNAPAQTSVPWVAWPCVRQIQDKFPLIDAVLADRLGLANWHRIYRLRTLAQQRGRGSAESPSSTNEAELSELNLARSAFVPISEYHDSGLGSSLPAKSNHAASVASHSSFRSTQTAAIRGGLRVPPTPVEVAQGIPFECAICLRPLRHIRNRQEWKVHVFTDIQPYICTFSECQSSRVTFPSRSLWADHEFQTHRNHEVLRCFACNIDFDSTTDFLDHARIKHTLVAGVEDSQLSALGSNSKIAILPIMEEQDCPMCRKKGFHTRRDFISHVGRHMEEIALVTLPSNVDSDDEAEITTSDISRLGSTHFDGAAEKAQESARMLNAGEGRPSGNDYTQGRGVIGEEIMPLGGSLTKEQLRLRSQKRSDPPTSDADTDSDVIPTYNILDPPAVKRRRQESNEGVDDAVSIGTRLVTSKRPPNEDKTIGITLKDRSVITVSDPDLKNYARFWRCCECRTKNQYVLLPRGSYCPSCDLHRHCSHCTPVYKESSVKDRYPDRKSRHY